jgi:uncharacterized protein YfaS (alpha-2-macroglobulin family)
VTIQTAWCVAAADAAGFDVPDRLATDVFENLVKIATRTIRSDAPSTLRTTALLVATLFEGFDAPPLEAAADELYLTRDTLPGEARAMLAVAMTFLEMDEAKRAQLIAEFPKETTDIAFDPRTFSSGKRAEAMMLWARLLNAPESATAPIQKQIESLLDQAPNLSTQENLWLLIVFESMVEQAKAPKIPATVRPTPDDISGNTTAVAWNAVDMTKLASFAASGLPNAPLSYVLNARYRKGDPSEATAKVANGMSVERVVKNLTDPSRDGSEAHPFRLGDQIAISYRFTADKPQAFVALEDMIPAGLEVVNPNLPAIAEYYPGVSFSSTAALSHSEMRDQQTNLYFDDVPAGAHEFAVLARATAAGGFVWPATQIVPMYDSRVFGRSPSSRCVVVP